MFVAPKIDWNSCGKISAMSSKTACCMLNRTKRGNWGFRLRQSVGGLCCWHGWMG